VIPESIKKERVADRGWTEDFIPGGHPENPLGSHRIELTLPLYSIHGTNNPWAVGRLVTHGCIRLYPEDIEPLFRLVERGVPGRFVYQPVKIGVRAGRVFAEVHEDIYGLVADLEEEAARMLTESGLAPFVDFTRLAGAIAERRGVPVDVSAPPTAPRSVAELEAAGGGGAGD
jgi:L,D-transpeptidase ErfK/SrfK